MIAREQRDQHFPNYCFEKYIIYMLQVPYTDESHDVCTTQTETYYPVSSHRILETTQIPYLEMCLPSLKCKVNVFLSRRWYFHFSSANYVFPCKYSGCCILDCSRWPGPWVTQSGLSTHFWDADDPNLPWLQPGIGFLYYSIFCASLNSPHTWYVHITWFVSPITSTQGNNIEFLLFSADTCLKGNPSNQFPRNSW